MFSLLFQVKWQESEMEDSTKPKQAWISHRPSTWKNNGTSIIYWKSSTVTELSKPRPILNLKSQGDLEFYYHRWCWTILLTTNHNKLGSMGFGSSALRDLAVEWKDPLTVFLMDGITINVWDCASLYMNLGNYDWGNNLLSWECL